MKLVNNVACPTTKLEQMALQNLKYGALEKDSINPLYMPLADENICNGTPRFLDELCGIYNKSKDSSGVILDWEGRFDGVVELRVKYPDGKEQDEVLGIPSNLHTLVAYYRGIGRYRKAVMIEKKYKKFM